MATGYLPARKASNTTQKCNWRDVWLYDWTKIFKMDLGMSRAFKESHIKGSPYLFIALVCIIFQELFSFG